MVTTCLLLPAWFFEYEPIAHAFPKVLPTNIYLKYIYITNILANYMPLCKKLLSNCKSKTFVQTKGYGKKPMNNEKIVIAIETTIFSFIMFIRLSSPCNACCFKLIEESMLISKRNAKHGMEYIKSFNTLLRW